LIQLAGRTRRALSLDWRGHGGSGPAPGDFGEAELIEDALAVIEASGAGEIVPVALAHANWVAIGLRRRLSARIPKIVLLDSLILGAPASFRESLEAMQSPELWRKAVQQIFGVWLQDVENPDLQVFVKEEMGSFGFEMWSRAAREIDAAYTREGSPLAALSRLSPTVPVLHLFAQPDDTEFLAAQRSFAAEHPWFRVEKLAARSHFPMFEAPEQIASSIEAFLGQAALAAGTK
jgi:pimeloyl-ACP methyl ester carboxylesterase